MSALHERPIENTPASPQDELWSSDATLNEAYLLYERYRPRANQVTPAAAAVKSLLPSHDWQVRTTEDQAQAWETHLQAIDKQAELERLPIEGASLLDFPLSDDELRDFLSMMPAVALQELSGITFQSDANRDDSHQASDAFVTMAYHRHTFSENSAQIVLESGVFNDIRRTVLERSDGSAAYGQAINQMMSDMVKSKLAHEVGHALHTTLPVSLLREWEDAIKDEYDIDVTTYVSRKRQQGSTRGLAVERFAETFGLLYDQTPRRRAVTALAQNAPDHYQGMQRILRKTGATVPDV